MAMFIIGRGFPQAVTFGAQSQICGVVNPARAYLFRGELFYLPVLDFLWGSQYIMINTW